MSHVTISMVSAAAAVPTESGPARTVEDALLSRRSIRAFLPTPVPRRQVERLLAMAARSASNSNCQPWQVHVLTGAAKRRLSSALLDAHDSGRRVPTREYSDRPRPEDWPEPFRSRRRQFGEGLYGQTLGISPEDTAGRLDLHRRNYEFFGAPVGLILTVPHQLLEAALVDAGLFLQSLMLAARGVGLDTCAQASFIDYFPVLRRELTIPDDQLIVCGIALGYADPEHRVNGHRTPREPLDSFATFYDENDAAATT